MPKLVNRAKMTTATTGTGTLTLGSAVDGYQTFANAGVANSNIVRYTIEDGSAWEIGLGTYSSTGTTLTRGTIESSTGTAINLSGNATVFVTAAAGDLQELVDFADNFVLPTADGSTGQVLTTNGAGTLSFSTITGYTNADVDTHLNTSTATTGEVLSWNGTDYDWVASGGGGATSLVELSDVFSANGNLIVASIPASYSSGSGNTGLGFSALRLLETGANNTAVGAKALDRNLSGSDNVALGVNAGLLITGGGNTVIGKASGQNLTSGTNNVCVGANIINTNDCTGNSNVAVGYEALRQLISGSDNIALGQSSAQRLSSGSDNVAIGRSTLDISQTGRYNIAVGRDAIGNGSASSTVGHNIAIGFQAGFDISTGTNNFVAGQSAGDGITSGAHNVAIGNNALGAATTGGRNIAIGQNAMSSGVATTALGNNVGIGVTALNAITTGTDNVGVGNTAGSTLTTGSNNTLLGNGAAATSATVSNEITLGNASVTRFRVPGLGIDWTSAPASLTGQTDSASPFETSLGSGAGAVNTGVNNTFIGFEAGNDNTTATDNTAVGFRSLDVATTGSRNTALGSNSLGGMTTGTDNVAVGRRAIEGSSSGSQNVAVGANSLLSSSMNATGNVAVGHSALSSNTGAENTAVGYFALNFNTTGERNVAVGTNAAFNLTTGSNNVAIGNGALDAATTGGRNIAIGQNAMGTGVATNSFGLNVAVGDGSLENVSSGVRNVGLGPFSGSSITTGSFNTLLGNNAQPSSATIDHEITLGNTSTVALRCQVTTITSLSDARDKTDIQPLNAGLEFVEALNPVSFTWNMRDGGKVGEADTGFIAQDLQMAQEWAGVTIPGLVYDVNPDKLEAGYGKLIPVLVQAIKDLSAKVNLLEAQLEAQK